MPSDQIPQTQTAALVHKLGGEVEFKTGYPVPKPKTNKVLVKVLFTGPRQPEILLPRSTNHLHHEDGSFQQYCVLDASYLAVLPDDIDPRIQGPVLSAGVTAYKAVLSANIQQGQYVVVLGPGGGLGRFAVQYGMALGAKVIAVDSGSEKKALVESYAVEAFVDFAKTKDIAVTCSPLPA